MRCLYKPPRLLLVPRLSGEHFIMLMTRKMGAHPPNSIRMKQPLILGQIPSSVCFLLSSPLPNSGLIPLTQVVTPASLWISPSHVSLFHSRFSPQQVFSTLLSCSFLPVAPQSGSHLFVTVFKTFHTLLGLTFYSVPRFFPIAPQIIYICLFPNLHQENILRLRISRCIFWALFGCRLTFYTLLPFSAPAFVSLSETSGLDK